MQSDVDTDKRGQSKNTTLQAKQDGLYERDASVLQVIKDDGYLVPFQQHFEIRNGRFYELLDSIITREVSLKEFAKGYEHYGLVARENGITYKEWAPNAKEVYLTGEFNNWDRRKHKCTQDAFGNWTLFLPRNADGSQVIPHNTLIKTHILDANNQWLDRLPAWITYTKQNENTKLFDGVFWNPGAKFQFKNKRPSRPHNLKIYEVHVGMAGIEPRVHSYQEFIINVLPRVVQLGYNTIQIMAIQEHAYYGSFGYHVTNFFAASSRFGNPEDLKQMLKICIQLFRIDAAHGAGIFVLMDLVHSHASSNVNDGINKWDGTDYHYFHAGQKGNHDLWDSRLFDYGKWEVMRFLLSNLSWWMNEYQFDGFRFDGISSMLYQHHGIGTSFGGGYHEYFSESTDIESVTYLMLANDLIHQIFKDSITIAEDVSGYPSLCRTIKDGGLGFDYRMAMAVPDNWIKMVKDQKDEDWSMSNMVHTLTNRRDKEKHVGYTECHDQALVGDKTIAMWLFGKDIYYNMDIDQPETLIITRGMALHKMIRLITLALGGEGYLTFMGNEFGHPEWIDFPREGNDWSYHYARRRWDIADNKSLRFSQLLQFEISMISLEQKYQWLSNQDQYITLKHDGDKIIVFERGPLVFVFNFHSDKSYEHYRIGTRFPHDHELVLDTDQAQFGGHSRVRDSYKQAFPIEKSEWCDRPNYIQIYIPSRCAMVFAPKA